MSEQNETATKEERPKVEETPAAAINNGTPKEEKKVKGPLEDPSGWLNLIGKHAVKKIAYQTLDWTNKTVEEDESKRAAIPGSKNESTSAKQLVDFLKDGTLLAKLANKLQPGSIETVHEGEAIKAKEKQTDNLNNFIGFLKGKVGLSDSEAFSAEDLQEKGSKGANSVLSSLMQLASRAQQQFNLPGIDEEQLKQVAAQAVKTGLIRRIMDFFRKRSQNQPKEHVSKATIEEKAEDKVEAVEETDKPAVETVEAPAVAAQ